MKKTPEAVSTGSWSKAIFAVAVFAVLGLITLLIVRAAQSPVSVEVERSSQQLVINDQNASGKKAIRFSRTGGGNDNNRGLEAFRYNGNNFDFSQFYNLSEAQVGTKLSVLTNSSRPPDNGDHPDGNFRIWCHYSHFLYDDPLIRPRKPGESHLHMFFGNTAIDAMTPPDERVRDKGGGSCQGGALNRTAYWMPALITNQGKVRPPTYMLIYYKTKRPTTVVQYPPGLVLFADRSNTFPEGFGWKCGNSGDLSPLQRLIPSSCPGDKPLQAAMEFPQCWNGRDLDSTDHKSHIKIIKKSQSCPASHPKRLVQLSIKVFWDNVAGRNLNGWYLSSDIERGKRETRGETLHSDWINGWNPVVHDIWFNNCIRRSRNCSHGQLGAPPNELRGPGSADYNGPIEFTLPGPLHNS